MWRVMKSVEMDGRMASERWWKDGEEFRVRKKVRKEVGDSVRSLIPAIVRGSVLLMCWGSHIVTENLSLSRHASCACTRVSATLVCCYHTCPIAKPHVNTFISWGDQSVKKCSDRCSDHMGCAHSVPHTPLTEWMRLGFVSLHQLHRLKK